MKTRILLMLVVALVPGCVASTATPTTQPALSQSGGPTAAIAAIAQSTLNLALTDAVNFAASQSVPWSQAESNLLQAQISGNAAQIAQAKAAIKSLEAATVAQAKAAGVALTAQATANLLTALEKQFSVSPN